MRVSIVATSLDGQQPEGKSVINMVHRIQNRNPGYSDFGSASSAQSFNFSTTMSSPISHGANALKLENEVIAEPTSDMINQQNLHSQEVESVVENNHTADHEQSFTEEAFNTTVETEESNMPLETEQTSNGLENFGVDEDAAPDLFSSDNGQNESDSFLSTENNENNSEDDDLEIPAFLRRQKN